MPRTILVPLDGSAIAEKALPVAAAIARQNGAALHLVSVHIPLITNAGELAPALNGELDHELRTQADHYLSSIAADAIAAHSLDVTFALLDGWPAQTLAGYAEAKHVDLIVMTTHGHGGISRFWLGSVTDGLLRRVKMPVLVLHASDKTLRTAFHNIVVALDGSIKSERTLEPAIRLATFSRNASYTLVQVVEPPIALITWMAMHPVQMRPHWQELQENSAHSYLERIAARLRRRDLSVTIAVLSGRGIGEQIVNFARTIGADLITVGTHGARGVERLLLGSVADKVIRSADQAVLVVPTPA